MEFIMVYDYVIKIDRNSYTISVVDDNKVETKRYYIDEQDETAYKEYEGEITKAARGKFSKEECSDNLEYQTYKIVEGLSHPLFVNHDVVLMNDQVKEMFRQLIIDDQLKQESSWFPETNEQCVITYDDQGVYSITIGDDSYTFEESLEIRKMFY